MGVILEDMYIGYVRKYRTAQIHHEAPVLRSHLPDLAHYNNLLPPSYESSVCGIKSLGTVYLVQRHLPMIFVVHSLHRFIGRVETSEDIVELRFVAKHLVSVQDMWSQKNV